MNPAHRTPPRPVNPRSAARGFSLVELLTAVAVLAILVTILVPTVGGARTAALKARTRAQFGQWAAAIEQFRQEYGSYPQFRTQGLINVIGADSTTPTAEHTFHDILTGQRRDPSANNWQTNRPNRVPPFPEVQNSRRVRFLTFSESDLISAADVAAGYAPNSQLNFICDAFHNTSIAVMVDRNLDGVINGRDITSGSPPAVTIPNTSTSLRPATSDVPTTTTGGIRANVIFYCAPPNATANTDLLFSWK
jgi:prepilin-type N-terminal cleavage/methylation domain-containing protein